MNEEVNEEKVNDEERGKEGKGGEMRELIKSRMRGGNQMER